MQMLDPIPGETLTRSEFSDVYLKPGKHPRRVDIVHEVYEEPAVAAWQAARDARVVYGTNAKHTQGPRGRTSQG